MWEGDKCSPFLSGKDDGCGKGKNNPLFSSVKDEGCGKRENVPHFSSGKDDGCEYGKNVPLFYQGRLRDVGRWKVFSMFFIREE